MAKVSKHALRIWIFWRAERGTGLLPHFVRNVAGLWLRVSLWMAAQRIVARSVCTNAPQMCAAVFFSSTFRMNFSVFITNL